jgi:hypothetical protein
MSVDIDSGAMQWFKYYVMGADVSKHLEFVNREGLSQEEGDALYGFVMGLGKIMGSAWRPSNCNVIPDLTDFANLHYHDGDRFGALFREFFTELVPKRFLAKHFFWCSESRVGDEIIILDPTGVPEHLTECGYLDPTIQPYFGIPRYARESNRFIYTKMQDMDSWGTRDLPPNFRP